MKNDKKLLEINKNFDIDKFYSIKRKNPIKKTSKMDSLTLANYSSIGYYLITPLILGLILGLYIDKLTGRSIFVVIGIIVGAIVTFYNLFRLLKQ